jgi:hypothetical protein
MKKLLLVLILLLTLSGCIKEKIPDTDGDGWDDAQEARAGTDPTRVDTDGDGLWDPLDPNPLDPGIPGMKEREEPQPEPESATEESTTEEVQEPIPETPPEETPETSPPAMPAAEATPVSYLEIVQNASPALVAEVNLGERVSELAASEDMVGVAAEGGFYLFNFRGELVFFHSTQAEAKHVVLSKEGMLYGATASWERRIFAISNGSILWIHNASDPVEELVLSGNGEVLAYSSGKRVYLLETENGSLLWRVDTDVDIASLALSADGSYIAVAGKDGSVGLYSRNGSLIWRWEGYTFDVDVLDVALDERGEHVAAGTNYYRILIFSSASPQVPLEIRTGAEVIQVFPAPDYSYFAAVSYDGSIYYFNTEGRVLFKRNYGRVYSKIAFSPSGSYAAAENSIRHIYFFT